MCIFSLKQLWARLMISSGIIFLSGLVQAADVPGKSKAMDTWQQKGIVASQLSAVQRVSRSVLATKTENPTDIEDRANLRALRDTVRALTEEELSQPVNLTLSSDSAESKAAAITAIPNERHQLAKELARKLRQRSEALRAQLKSSRNLTSESALNDQRAQQLLKWSNQLEDVVASNPSSRSSKLIQLNTSLQNDMHVTAPSELRTPTLQSMPSESGALVPVHQGE